MSLEAMLTIDVLPTKASAETMKHPHGPVLGKGATWPNDSFTARRIVDGSVKRKAIEHEPAPSEPSIV